jgi:hypothetical protein
LSYILSLLISLFSFTKQTCLSTVFNTPGDKLAGGAFACGNAQAEGIAHRTLPCGTKVLLVNNRTKDWTITQVVDRGPYGAIDEFGNWFVKKTSQEGGIWRGCVDLTPKIQKLLNHNGLERISVYSVK